MPHISRHTVKPLIIGKLVRILVFILCAIEMSHAVENNTNTHLIPNELWVHTFRYLDPMTLLNIERTCRQFRSISLEHDKEVWYPHIGVKTFPTKEHQIILKTFKGQFTSWRKTVLLSHKIGCTIRTFINNRFFLKPSIVDNIISSLGLGQEENNKLPSLDIQEIQNIIPSRREYLVTESHIQTILTPYSPKAFTQIYSLITSLTADLNKTHEIGINKGSATYTVPTEYSNNFLETLLSSIFQVITLEEYEGIIQLLDQYQDHRESKTSSTLNKSPANLISLFCTTRRKEAKKNYGAPHLALRFLSKDWLEAIYLFFGLGKGDSRKTFSQRIANLKELGASNLIAHYFWISYLYHNPKVHNQLLMEYLEKGSAISFNFYDHVTNPLDTESIPEILSKALAGQIKAQTYLLESIKDEDNRKQLDTYFAALNLILKWNYIS